MSSEKGGGEYEFPMVKKNYKKKEVTAAVEGSF